MVLKSFVFFLFMPGSGKSPTRPAATKAVAEWFPKHERGWAVALFDSGSSIGGAGASVLVLWLYYHFGWRGAFVVPRLLRPFWVSGFRLLFSPPLAPSRPGRAGRG